VLISDSVDENSQKAGNQPDHHGHASGQQDNSVPYWARTPALAAALFNQKTVRPEDIFGQVQPIKLEGTYHPPMSSSLIDPL
jgi:hypothetical protein